MNDFFYLINGRIEFDQSNLPSDAHIEKHYRLRGGKGGFGSMLRAIGSQIEKTTNHEMCRDLTGRRMRDVNMEKKLREWYAKASEREKAKLERYLERKRKRQEMLKEGPLPGHKFEDREYDAQKQRITDDLQKSMEFVCHITAFLLSALSKIVNESKSDQAPLTPGCSSTSCAPSYKRQRLWLESLDDGSSSGSSSSDIFSGTEDKSGTDIAVSTIDVISGPDALELGSQAQDAHVIALHSEATSDKVESEFVKIDVRPSKINIEGDHDNQTLEVPLTDEQLLDSTLFPTSDVLASTVSLNVLKLSLQSRQLKCGGTALERAQRLFAVRGLTLEQYPDKLRAKPNEAKKT
ncbi:unnamed protein product [Protopolystoma xenopodis]|uniref:Uncharacterized protein n=1 Tax=Protopolystoma xenopodis TaxID=117903 RepID=A0A3S5BRY8_9PLAT|nr:unnamed protein product [Protopolystoma xenopodis]